MFSTTTDEHSIYLHFKNEFMSLVFCPETITNVTTEIGRFDLKPSNGESYFTWNEESVVFRCSKYGCGQGGDLTISLLSTPELLASLKKCVQEIRAYSNQDL